MFIKTKNWIKDKWLRFKKWFIGLFVITALAASSPALIPAQAQYITAPENNGYKMGVQNFEYNLAQDGSLQYKLEDKYIEFKPVGMRWQGESKKFKENKRVSKTKRDIKLYKDIFGKGIDLELKTSERVWSKVVEIESLESLGKISNAEYLEIIYEVDTNFIIDGWNKESKFELSTSSPTRLGDFSYLDPAQAWDSYREEVCEIIEEENVCDTLTNRINIKSYFNKKSGKTYYIKQIPVSWLKSAQYPIWTDVDITYGTTQDFETGDSSMNPSGYAICELDTDKFVVIYRDNTDSSEAKAVVGTVSGTTITFGGIVSLSGNGVSSASTGACAKLDTDKFAACWENAADSDLDCLVATVSTRTISAGSIDTLASGQLVTGITMAQLGTDKFVFAYEDTNSRTEVGVATVSGTIFTNGSIIMFESGDQGVPALAKLDTDKFVVCFRTNIDDGNCEVGTVSGTSITANGTEYTYEVDSAAYGRSVKQLDTDKFVIGWRDGLTTTLFLEARIATVSGGAITYGTAVTIDSNDVGNLGMAKIDSSRFVVVYEDDADTDDGESVLSSFSGTTITAGSNENWDTGTVFGSNVELISSLKIAVCYVDDDGGDDGACIIGDVSALAAAARRAFLIMP